MEPLNILETSTQDESDPAKLWLRGGFPDSYLAENDGDSYAYRRNFIRTYLERDVAQFGPCIPAETLERLWIMLAHNQGQFLNALDWQEAYPFLHPLSVAMLIFWLICY